MDAVDAQRLGHQMSVAPSEPALHAEVKSRAVIPRCFLQLYAPGFIPRTFGAAGPPIDAFADPEFCAGQSPELLARIEQSLHARLKHTVKSRRAGPACVLATASACAIARQHARGFLSSVLDAHAKRYPNSPLELNHIVSLRAKLRLGTQRLIQLGHLLDAAESGQLASIGPQPTVPQPYEHLSQELLDRLLALAGGPAGEKVIPNEGRFGPLFGLAFPAQLNLRTALSHAITEAVAYPSSAERLAAELEAAEQATVSEEIAAVARLLAKGRRQSARDADWFAQRYGVKGHPQSTLQAIGSAYALTRERVRQVIDRLLRRLQGHSVFLPATMKALAEVDSLLPKPEPELNAALARQLGGQLEVASLFEFAVDIGALPVRTNLAFIRPRDDVRVAARRHSHEWVKACGMLAGKMISNTGAAQLHWLAGALAQRGHRVSPDEVRGVVMARLGFDWLGEDSGWFWFGPEETENRVINAARKMLAVAVRAVDCDDLYAGFARYRRLQKRDSLPGELYVPPEVFREILARSPLFRRSQMNNFSLVKGLPLQDVLSETESRVFELVRERSGVAARHELHDVMVNKGQSQLRDI